MSKDASPVKARGRGVDLGSQGERDPGERERERAWDMGGVY